MSSANTARYAISDADLTTASTTQKYPCGYKHRIEDLSSYTAVKEYIYLQFPNGATAYGAYTIKPSLTAAKDLQNVIPATVSVAAPVCVPQFTVASSSYAFAQIEGDAYVSLPTLSSSTAGDFGKLTNAAITVTDDSSTEAATSIGMFQTTTASAGTATIYLTNKRVTI